MILNLFFYAFTSSNDLSNLNLVFLIFIDIVQLDLIKFNELLDFRFKK